MSKLTQSVLRLLLTFSILFTGLASTIWTVYAEDGSEGLIITPTIEVGDCGEVSFVFEWKNGTGDDLYSMYFGTGDKAIDIPITEDSITLPYTYVTHGDFQWTFQIGDVSISDTLTIGPKVTLNSSPFPPIFVVGKSHEVIFSTLVTGGTPPLTYTWDLGGDDPVVDVTGEGAKDTYTDIGKYYPEVMVTDSCGFTNSDNLPVIVANPEDVCHPMAQKISDGVNLIFPDQSEDLYTCDEIYAIFDNETEENNLGFGRMWKAYHLAESMEELTWEDILDWHLNESGWGSLLQMDRFADLLEEHDLPELMGLVMSEDFSLGDVRTAVRSVTRYEADFDDALTRVADGANPGELGQFYKLAADLDLEADLEVLDGYLADGMTLSELKHTSKFADQMEIDWTEVADARGEVDSWGDLSQAYRLATDDMSVTNILELPGGVQEYKESLRDEDKVVRELLREEDKAAREEKQTSRTEETAEKLAEQFTAESGDVMNLLNGECKGDWACVRKALRDQKQEMSESNSEKDIQTALQIAFKYGYSEAQVLAYHKDYCGEDWSCTRAYFREHTLIIKETGKPDKK